MKSTIGNIFELIPKEINDELFEDIISNDNVRIERIISKGHISPELGWYDQSENEWIIILQGAAKIEFENKSVTDLVCGSYLNIPAHCKHKVAWTDPTTETIWLAIYYK